MAKTKIPGEYLQNSVVRFTAKAGENITKGQAVYISGISGEVPVVSLADADDTNKMPAFGLAESTVSTNASVEITSNGTLAGIDTSSYALGDILYISTTAGSLTNDPSGLEASKVQNIGMVQRVHASNGSIKVGGAGRTNATPNLNDGNIFVGNSSNKSVADSFTDVLNDQAGINSSANATAITIDSSENVGIGTASPTADLSVGSTATSSGDVHLRTTKTAFSITPSNTDAGGILLDLGWVSGGQGPMKFGIGSSEKMRIDSSGNVGIGVTNPSSYYAKNLVVAAPDEGGISVVSNSTHQAYLMFADGTSGSQAYRGYLGYDHNNDNFNIISNGIIKFYTDDPSTEKMRIDSSGDVRIGSITNAYAFAQKLRVGDGDDNDGITINSGSTHQGNLAFCQGAGGNTAFGRISYQHGTNYMQFFTNNTERMRITSTGNLEFKSTTTTFTGASSFTNHSNGVLYLRGGTSGLRLDNDDSTNTIHVSGAGNYIAFETLNGTERWRFNSSGHFTPAQQHAYDIGGVNAEVRNIYAQGLYVGGSAAANKLDDYEEGTWTPVLGPGSGQSYGNRAGHYTKVGRMVTAYFGARLTAGSFTSGEATITGLPFAVHATGSYQEPQFTIYTLGNCPTGITGAVGPSNSLIPGQVSFYLASNETQGRGRKFTANADTVLDANEIFDSNSFIKGVVVYYTA